MGPYTLIFIVNVFLIIIGILAFREERATKLDYENKVNLLIFGILFLTIMLLKQAEIEIDALVTSKLGLDFTKIIYNIEGDATAIFQAIRSPVLDYYFTIVYMIGFPFLLYFTPLLYIFSKDIKSLKFVVVAYIIAIVASLPFLIFFPVYDVWYSCQNFPWYNGKPVYFTLGDIWPGIVNVFFTFTTVDNCFPSLHCCLSAVMAYTAWIKGYNKYKYVVAVMAISIPLATLYLGIHWITDIIAGEIIALIAIVLAMKLCGEKWR